MEEEGHPTPSGHSLSSHVEAPQKATVASQQQFLVFPALPLLSGTSSMEIVVIYFPLIFSTSELATKLSGNLTFSITICVMVHPIPVPSAHQVLIPAKTTYPLCAFFWGSPLKLRHSVTTHKADVSLCLSATSFHSSVVQQRAGHPLSFSTTRSLFLWKSSKAI